MPFAGFEDFDACVVAQRGKGKTEESARKICGFLQAQAESKKAADLAEYAVWPADMAEPVPTDEPDPQ